MTVTIVTTIQKYQGLSTDEKPSSPNEGSTFHAVDTGEQFVFYNGLWEYDLRLQTALGNI